MVTALTVRAEAGDPLAQNALALLKLRGDGTARDPEGAARLFREAALAGLREAKANLGLLYVRGDGVGQNGARGAELIRQAAEQGLPDAQFSYGWLLDTGTAIARDAEAARGWYEKSALMGVQRAQYNLARLLSARSTGDDAGRRARALTWFLVVARGEPGRLRDAANAAATRLSSELRPAEVEAASDDAVALWRRIKDQKPNP